jgi:hypothetical protein
MKRTFSLLEFDADGNLKAVLYTNKAYFGFKSTMEIMDLKWAKELQKQHPDRDFVWEVIVSKGGKCIDHTRTPLKEDTSQS